jgi:hypothetical protein
VFAPNFKQRKHIVPQRSGRIDADHPPAPMTWAQRLRRVFAIDIETCWPTGDSASRSPAWYVDFAPTTDQQYSLGSGNSCFILPIREDGCYGLRRRYR